MGTYIDTRPCAVHTVPMMGMRVPGTGASEDRLYRCTAPGCENTAMSDYPPICAKHDIPMVEVQEEAENPRTG
jgi:hypothetical protein